MGYKDKFLALPIFGNAIRDLTILTYLRIETIEKLAEQFADILEIKTEYTEIVELLKQHETGEHYHGLHHALVTFIAAVEGGVVSPTLTDEEMPILAMAALGHDVYHSRGQEPKDSDNVYRATGAVRMIVAKTRGDEVAKQVVTAIRATTFPWSPHVRPDIVGKVLRDADMMASYLQCEKLLKVLFQGLYNETKYRTGQSPEEFQIAQKNFRRAIAWNSNWAKMKAVKHNFINTTITPVE